ncbi:MAG: TIGR04551 family protein [Pseudomonadota bacterium]
MRPVLLVLALLLAAPGQAQWDQVSTPFTTAGAAPSFGMQGVFRVRTDLDANLDLDRGPTPSGELLFPAPASDPQNGQILLGADMRLRLQPRVSYKGIALHALVDVLDNLALGSTPHPAAASSVVTGQDPPRFGVNSLVDAVAIKRVWGEAALPVGMLAVGRMPNHWGLGLVANNGLCDECDGADSADRVAFVTPLLGHLWGVGFDWSASGPVTERDGRWLDREPRDDVRSASAMVLNTLPDPALQRKLRAGKLVLHYGLIGSLRWQDREALSAGQDDALVWIDRGFTGGLVDGWVRLRWAGLRVEAEFAYLGARYDNASLLPGVRLNQPATAQQWGGAIETEWRADDELWHLGLDLNVASGDPAPGFGAREMSRLGAPGDLDGAQVHPPYDLAVDNFRFHPDHHLDRILWRQIVGTFTDGVALRARAGLSPLRGLSLELWAVGSAALFAESAPGHSNLLGIELDPTVRYRSNDGFELLLAYGVLFPLDGLASVENQLAASPGQTLRVMTRFAF